MVLGIGTDILEIKRMTKAILKESFKKKCFTQQELDFLSEKKANSYAGYFCAKEAAAKALGLGFRGFSPRDIEIKKDKYNKPILYLHGNALELSKQMGITNMHLSISHSLQYATAVVVFEAL